MVCRSNGRLRWILFWLPLGVLINSRIQGAASSGSVNLIVVPEPGWLTA